MWKPIDTAPRDGTWFLICKADDGAESVEVGRYDPLIRYEYEPIDGGLFKRREVVSYEWTGFNNFCRATHWMPLPDLPDQPRT